METGRKSEKGKREGKEGDNDGQKDRGNGMVVKGETRGVGI